MSLDEIPSASWNTLENNLTAVLRSSETTFSQFPVLPGKHCLNLRSSGFSGGGFSDGMRVSSVPRAARAENSIQEEISEGVSTPWCSRAMLLGVEKKKRDGWDCPFEGKRIRLDFEYCPECYYETLFHFFFFFFCLGPDLDFLRVGVYNSKPTGSIRRLLLEWYYPFFFVLRKLENNSLGYWTKD